MQTINIGASANDGTGDTIRNSFSKANSNFNELVASISSIQSAALSGLDPNKYQGQITALGQAIPAPGTSGRWYYITVTGTLTDPDAAVTVTSNGYLIDNGTAWLFQSGVSSSLIVAASADIDNRSFPVGKNRFDETRVLQNTLIRQSNGTTETIAGYQSTDYIPVTPGGTVISNKAFFSDATRGTAFYDSNKVFISSIAAFAANTPISVPAGAFFMRSTIGTAGVNIRGWYVGDGSTLPSIIPSFKLIDSQSDRDQNIKAIREIGGFSNIFNKFGIISGFTLSTGGTIAAGSSFSISNYMPVIPGEQIILSEGTAAGAGFGIVYYDLNFNRLATSQAGSILGNTPYTVPSLAAYARMTVLNSVAERLGVYNGSTLPLFFSNFGVTGAINKRWKGKGLGFIGDSITDAEGWKEAATRYLEGSMILDSGTSGSSMGHKIGAITPGSLSGTLQVTTATGIGTVSSAGNASVVVTSSQIPVSPVTVSVAVSTGSPSVWMAQVRAALAANSSITSRFTVGGSGDTVTLTSTTALVNDSSLNISISTGTAVGITSAPTSVATTAGAAGVDLAVVALGTNDWGFNRPLGAFGDAASPAASYGVYNGPGTFYGDVRGLIEAILTEKPTVRVAFTTPLPRSAAATGGSGAGVSAVNGNGATLRQFVDAIIQTCATYSIPVLDLNRKSGWNPYNIASYYASDGLHPNVAGYASYSPMVGSFLESL